MADGAIVAGRLGVPSRLALRDRAVVATEATADYRVMIDAKNRGPAQYAVAFLAGVAGKDMRGVFRRRCDAVVAVDAIAGNTAMVEYHVRPGKGSMAVVAIVAAWHMRGMLAQCDHAVVAALAAPDHGEMIDLENIGPAGATVTVFTFPGCGDVPG